MSTESPARVVRCPPMPLTTRDKLLIAAIVLLLMLLAVGYLWFLFVGPGDIDIDAPYD